MRIDQPLLALWEELRAYWRASQAGDDSARPTHEAGIAHALSWLLQAHLVDDPRWGRWRSTDGCVVTEIDLTGPRSLALRGRVFWLGDQGSNPAAPFEARASVEPTGELAYVRLSTAYQSRTADAIGLV